MRGPTRSVLLASISGARARIIIAKQSWLLPVVLRARCSAGMTIKDLLAQRRDTVNRVYLPQAREAEPCEAVYSFSIFLDRIL